MTRSVAKPLLIIVLAATLFGILIYVKSLLMPTLYYPYLAIVAPENIRIHILQRGQTHASQCARSLESQIAAISGTCSTCPIVTSNCLTDLGETMQKWLEEEAITSASARMAYGVVVFDALDQHVALAACQESEKQAHAKTLAGHITCFPAGSLRPPLTVEKNILERERVERQKSLLIAGGSIIGVTALIVAFLASLRRLAVREPTEDTSIELDAAQPAALKLSNILKRVLDIVLAVTLLVALLPIFLVIAVLIRIFEGQPIFYMSHRFISTDKRVTIFKFRTMVKDATSPKYRLKERFMRDGYLDIPLSCEVYTPIGRLLERSQLVETLQLLNILFDGMSFVGNRPLPKENIELLGKFDGWQGRFESPAGITGISQVVGKYGLLPQQRLYLERLYASVYVNPRGNIVLCDLYIIGYTIFLLFTEQYVYYEKAIELLIRCGADTRLSSHVSASDQSARSDRG